MSPSDKNALTTVDATETHSRTPYILEVLTAARGWRPYGGIFHVAGPVEAVAKAQSRIPDARDHFSQWEDVQGFRVTQILAITSIEGE